MKDIVVRLPLTMYYFRQSISFASGYCTDHWVECPERGESETPGSANINEYLAMPAARQQIELINKARYENNKQTIPKRANPKLGLPIYPLISANPAIGSLFSARRQTTSSD